jgi:hypothetical protein
MSATSVTPSIAKWISILAHPFVMVAVMVIVAGSRFAAGAEVLYPALLVLAIVLIPTSIVMFVQVRRKRWANSDASNMSERPWLLLVILIALIVLLGFLLLQDPNSFLIKGVFASGLMVLVALIGTRWMKMSIHMAFAGFACTLLCILGSVVGYVLLVVVPLLAWSRLALKRHRPHELVLGLALGVLAGAALGYS